MSALTIDLLDLAKLTLKEPSKKLPFADGRSAYTASVDVRAQVCTHIAFLVFTNLNNHEPSKKFPFC